MSDSEFRPGRSVGNPCNPMQQQLTEELQQRWAGWIDARVAAAMADAIKTVAESIGNVLAKERERTRGEVKAAVATSQAETQSC